jgi:hypothetical protein
MNHFEMELTQRQAKEYKKATKKQKGEIITRYCRLVGLDGNLVRHRNLVSKRFRKVIRDIHPRVLKTKLDQQSKRSTVKKRGRKPTYTSTHRAIIRKAWDLSGEVCGERLHPVLDEYLDQLAENDKLKYFGQRHIQETKKVSQRTLKRIIANFPKAGKRKRNKGNASIYKAIPIHAYFGENAYRSGYIEVDYVEHSGGNSSGTFANTGCYVDVCLGWIARAAGLGKNLHSVSQIHDRNERRIYHQVKEYHPDNAKPILKLLLERKLNPDEANRHHDYRISRSRPYHKEDNGHVEQKNGDKVRKLVGYHRYDNEEQVGLLNRLFEIEDLISNFFLPSQKLIEKVKDDQGRVVRRKYDKAKTPYQRLLEAEDIDPKTKERVRKIYAKLNLVELRKESNKIQKQLYRMVVGQ